MEKKGLENLLKEIMLENFTNLDGKWTSRFIKSEKQIKKIQKNRKSKHIVNKLLKFQHKETFKRSKRNITCCITSYKRVPAN